MGTPEIYEIRVDGHLGRSWLEWLEGMSILHEDSGETVLRGPLTDQAALHGVLMRIRDLGLPLVAVNRMPRATAQMPGSETTEEGQR